MSVLVLIPARGGSKRLPGKNLRTVGGVSLVGHAVRCAHGFLDDVEPENATVMCDTDSQEIADEAIAHGAWVPFLREPEWAHDTTRSADTVIRTMERLGTDDWTTLILLQPTSPLRAVDDVVKCYRIWQDMMGNAVISIDRRTQKPNGAVYVIWALELRQSKSFLPGYVGIHSMPPERSIDINTEADLAEAERLWRLQHG